MSRRAMQQVLRTDPRRLGGSDTESGYTVAQRLRHTASASLMHFPLVFKTVSDQADSVSLTAASHALCTARACSCVGLILDFEFCDWPASTPRSMAFYALVLVYSGYKQRGFGAGGSL